MYNKRGNNVGMKIKDGIEILKAEKTLGRTPKAWPLSEYAQEVIEATLLDQKNYESDLTQCLNCAFTFSSLLSSDGCPNCGVSDLTLNVEKGSKI